MQNSWKLRGFYFFRHQRHFGGVGMFAVRSKIMLHSSYVYPIPNCLYTILYTSFIIYPRRACAARVLQLGVWCVCVSVTLHLTSRMFVRLTNDITYLTGNEGQKICAVFSENAPLQSQSAKKPICKYATDGMAYRSLIDPAAPEDATGSRQETTSNS